MRLVVIEPEGVIQRPHQLKDKEEWTPIADTLEAIARLNHDGYRVIVASNRLGMLRGRFSLAAFLRVTEKMHSAVADAGGSIEAVFFCPHAAADDCACRKPKPGLLLDIAARLHIDIKNIYVVGTSADDAAAALAAGAQAILTGSGPIVEPGHGIAYYPDFPAVADALLNGARQ